VFEVVDFDQLLIALLCFFVELMGEGVDCEFVLLEGSLRFEEVVILCGELLGDGL
jgi:hypothetical protein